MTDRYHSAKFLLIDNVIYIFLIMCGFSHACLDIVPLRSYCAFRRLLSCLCLTHVNFLGGVFFIFIFFYFTYVTARSKKSRRLLAAQQGSSHPLLDPAVA